MIFVDLVHPDSRGECLMPASVSPPPGGTNWDEVLVDEVDFINAFKTGKISKDDCHISSIKKELLEEDSSDDVDEAKISFHDEVLTDDENMSETSSIEVLI
ncbi:unnamed protein product [Gongylonema pulchrum]|uniref:DDE-1 domain-containing protein n=1 Tax=Gongylonema pulchrum TaxID=637853 RepID=A0A183D2H6_9BILA|nr:unnamed protein product [Gongylonema pulchrum]